MQGQLRVAAGVRCAVMPPMETLLSDRQGSKDLIGGAAVEKAQVLKPWVESLIIKICFV